MQFQKDLHILCSYVLIHGGGDKLVTRELLSYEYIKSDSIQNQVLNHLKFRTPGQ